MGSFGPTEVTPLLLLIIINNIQHHLAVTCFSKTHRQHIIFINFIIASNRYSVDLMMIASLFPPFPCGLEISCGGCIGFCLSKQVGIQRGRREDLPNTPIINGGIFFIVIIVIAFHVLQLNVRHFMPLSVVVFISTKHVTQHYKENANPCDCPHGNTKQRPQLTSSTPGRSILLVIVPRCNDMHSSDSNGAISLFKGPSDQCGDIVALRIRNKRRCVVES
mmetsp:Transcript_1792/g.2588  ORF Transcript_1792/g.2588 Transcript_1792/m.2588 type:complete len:220 (-) Transcript_1792:411-1070(-)